jgi:cell division protein FtsB
MREYQQKALIRTVLYSRVTIVILFLLVVLLLRSIMELNDKRIAVKKLQVDSAAKRQDLEGKVQTAQEKNDSIATDRGFENYVRTTYPVVKEGEGVIVVYDAPTSPVAPVRADMTIWERLQVYFQSVFAKK